MTIELTNVEKIFLLGLAAREREIIKLWSNPLQVDYAFVVAEIEKTHNLPSGSIGKEYFIDLQSLSLQENGKS